jgi:lipoate-protein ligase B
VLAGTCRTTSHSNLQQQLVDARRDDAIPDQLLLLEHPHVITLGIVERREHVLVDEEQRRCSASRCSRPGAAAM